MGQNAKLVSKLHLIEIILLIQVVPIFWRLTYFDINNILIQINDFPSPHNEDKLHHSLTWATQIISKFFE